MVRRMTSLPDLIELEPTAMAHGGDAVARADGKVYFIPDALPGERVLASVQVDKGSFARTALHRVMEPSLARIEPRCAHAATCGGCQWQHADYESQLVWKEQIVAGQLAHLGGIEDPPVREMIAPGPPFNYRNRMDYVVDGGRPALHRRQSNDTEQLAECVVLAAPLVDLFDRLGDLSGLSRITIRAGIHTGDLLAVIVGRPPPHVEAWQCSVVRRRGSRNEVVVGRGHLFEEVAGARFRITGGAFFQNNTAGAEAIVGTVDAALEVRSDESMLDGYAGGGLFAATVGLAAGSVTAVESSPVAMKDLRHNTMHLRRVSVIDQPFESVDVGRGWDVAVVDPPRAGLGQDGVRVLLEAELRAIAYVSCDPASLSRDSRLLIEGGYVLDWVQPVDMFPQTFHVEAVAKFVAR